MSEPTFRDDLTHESGREEGISGALVPDEKGYRRAIFTDTTRDQLKVTFGKHIQTVLDDYKKIDARRELNIKAYEGLSDKGEAITIPIIKRDANQQLAWLMDKLTSKSPFVTVRPLEAGYIELVVQDEEGRATIEIATTEEEADALEALTNYYLTDKLQLQKQVRTFVTELLRDGNRPPVWKVFHEEREIQVRSMGLSVGDYFEGEDGKKRAIVERIEKDPVYINARDGEPTRIEVIPGDKFFIPLPEYDIQKAPFVFQEFEEDTATIKDKIARGTYDFCREGEVPPDEVEIVLSGMSVDEAQKARTDGRVPSDPMGKHRLFELWLDYPFAQEIPDPLNPEGVTVEVSMVRFCAVVHWPSQTWLNCYENFYWHGKRPFFAGRQQERPFSFSGYSISENIAPHQRLISQLFHAQLQNLAVQNVKVLYARENSTTFRFLTKKGQKLRPGLVIPFDRPEDIKPDPLGTGFGSMANEIAFLNGEAEKLSTVHEHDRGAVPGRTPVGTVQAIDQLAKVQPAMVLNGIRETLSDVIKCYVQTLIQFSPTGIAIPFRKPKTTALIKRVISFPRELIVDQFSFEITATADDETPAALINRDMMLGAEVRKTIMDIRQLAAEGWLPGTPPPLMNITTKFMVGLRHCTARLLEHARLNPDDFMPSEKEIEAVPLELMKMQQMMQQAAPGMGSGMPGMGMDPGMMQGAMSGIPGADSGAALPPFESGGVPGAGLVEAQPDDFGPVDGGVPADIPPQF